MIMASSALSDKRARHFSQGVELTLTETPFERGLAVSCGWPCKSLLTRLWMTKVAETEVISLTNKERRGCQGLMKCHLDRGSCSGIDLEYRHETRHVCIRPATCN